MRVALCSLSSGGNAHYTYSLAEALHELGVAPTVMTYVEPPYDLAEFPHRHRVIGRLRMSASRAARAVNPIRNLAVVARATAASRLVHFQWPLGPRTDPIHWPLLRRAGKKIVYTAHDVLPHESNVLPIEHCRWLYHHADALIVHGPELKALMIERFDVDPGSVEVISHGNYNFVADAPSRWNRRTARESFGWDDGDRVVLFFGLIRPYKGLDDLIEAARIIQSRGLERGERLRVLVAGEIIGDTWQKGGYTAQIENAGLREQMRLHLEYMAMADVARFFHAADVVAVPYKRGSQSGVLHLAFAFGKPAVVTRVGSLPQAAAQGAVARLVAPEQPSELAEALRELLTSREAAERLGRLGREHADTVLGWRSIAEKTARVYERVLADW